MARVNNKREGTKPMSFNQPPPDPYGQQPQQPGPPPGYGYPQQGGIPQQPQQPGPYGYPQQNPYGGQVPPPQNPYGGQAPAAQNPYGVQPNPAYGQQPPNPAYGQPGWGAPPPPPKKNTGKVIAIVLGAVVVVGGGIAIATSVGGGGGGGSATGPKYKLTTPATVAGDFTKQAGTNSSTSDDLDNTPGITDAHNVQAGYANGSSEQLEFFGAYGTVGDPTAVVDSAFSQLDKQSSSSGDTDGKAIGSPQSVSPIGLGDAVMKCQIFSADEDGISAKFPICIWGDSSTVGVVAYVDGTAVVTGGSVSVEDGAKITAEVRTSTRVKISS
jgi:hypothetical protein